MPAVAYQRRREERTDLFVCASVHSRAGAVMVHVRNLSPAGALIEGEALPPLGHELELRRGSLVVAGEIVWRSGVQAGVSFSERTVVEDWFSDAQPQQAVDDTFHRIMEDMRERVSTRTSHAPVHDSVITFDDMHRVAGSLDTLADALSEDPELIMRLVDELQTLDIAAQLLRKLAQQERPRKA